MRANNSYLVKDGDEKKKKDKGKLKSKKRLRTKETGGWGKKNGKKRGQIGIRNEKDGDRDWGLGVSEEEF
jgi:hypothetical protein